MGKVIVLVLVIVAAVVGIVVMTQKGQPPTLPEDEADRPLLEPMKCAACGHQESKIQDNGEKLELGEGPQAKQYGKLRKCPKCGKFSFGFIEEDPDYGKYLAPKLHAPHPKRK